MPCIGALGRDLAADCPLRTLVPCISDVLTDTWGRPVLSRRLGRPLTTRLLLPFGPKVVFRALGVPRNLKVSTPTVLPVAECGSLA